MSVVPRRSPSEPIAIPLGDTGCAARGAVLVCAPQHGDPQDVAQALAIDRALSPVLVVCGGAGGLAGDELARARAIVVRGSRPWLVASARIVVDGGTDTGGMALVGEARAEDPYALPVLVRVAPGRLVAESGAAPERSHSHVLLVDGARTGEEHPLMLGLAEALAGGCPIAMFVVGGCEGALAERELERRRTVLSGLAIAASGAGAFVVAAGAETWVALTTPLGQTHAAFHRLANDVETVLTNEHVVWVQQMNEALTQLRERQEQYSATVLARGGRSEVRLP